MKKKIQVWYWLISSFFKKHRRLIILGASLGIVFSFFFIKILPFIPRPNPERKIGMVGQYNTNELPSFVTSKISQGLTIVMPDGKPMPMLAKQWKLSEDGRIYTFVLHDDIYWQDGTKVIASDLNYNFTDVAVNIINDFTIQFELNESYAPFPSLLSKPILKNNKIGTGEYSIKYIKEKNAFVSEISLESKQENLLIKFYPNQESAKLAFKMGEIDEIREIFQNPFESEEDWNNIIKVEKNRAYTEHVALYLNNNDPTLKESKGFRQALAYAVRKPQDETIRAIGPISLNSWAYNKDLKPYNFNPERALELAEKEFQDKDKLKEITLTISTTASLLSLAEQIKNDWAEVLGIKVETEVLNFLDSNFQILLTSQEIPSDPDQYFLWHSISKNNIISFNNIRIDSLLEKGRQEIDEKKRADIYYDFQKFFVEECPVIFLYYPEKYSITRKNLVKTNFWKIVRFGLDEPVAN